ncbi:MAG: hypothetical protein EZS28_021250 [Streblomastix strix]|uniref:Uncharacterized protein n=1 Tax=Streblomastix strix TaxID=222440 RepID=A0A5J4VLW1_9EUKA|nr:MAG: hypothetical protein EZS28_021250 [Streblomastix strix]
MKSPTIPEVEPQFEKEIDPFQQSFQEQVIRCETPTLSAKRRSLIFEETLTLDSQVCRLLLDIISQDEHMVKESAHFALSENQLIRVVDYISDVSESQVQLSIDDEGCYGRLCSYSTQTLNEILIRNVNILKLDVDKVNLLKDSYKISPEPYNREEIGEILDEKLNISDQFDAYSKTEDCSLMLLKVDKTQLIDACNKSEIDAILDDKFNISDQIDDYSRTYDDEIIDEKLNITDQIDAYIKYEDDALLLLKTDKSELIDAYSKTEDDELLALKLNISDQIDAYNKSEVDALLDDKLNISDQIDAYTKLDDYLLLVLKVDKTVLFDAYSKTEADALLDNKLNISDQIEAYTKQEDDELLLFKADRTELDSYVDLTSTQTITEQK